MLIDPNIIKPNYNPDDIGDFEAKREKEDKLNNKSEIEAQVDWELADYMRNYWSEEYEPKKEK